MDMMSFLKTVPAVIGVAGLLMYFMMRARSPVSNHELVTLVQRVRNTFLLLGCAALILLSAWLILRPPPPDRDIGPEWGAGGRDGRMARLAAIGGIDTTRAASTRHPSRQAGELPLRSALFKLASHNYLLKRESYIK